MLQKDMLGALESRGALGGCAWSPVLAVLVGKQNGAMGPLQQKQCCFCFLRNEGALLSECLKNMSAGCFKIAFKLRLCTILTTLRSVQPRTKSQPVQLMQFW